jgi:hypothetical protein
MRKLLIVAAVALLVAAPLLVLAFAPAPDAGSRPVEHKTWNGYAESRDSGLKGEASFLTFAAKAEFARVFEPVLTPRGVPDPIAKDAFDKQLFVAVIKRGDVLWDYKVEKVTASGEALTVRYQATPRGRRAEGSTTARGDSKKAFATTEKAAPRMDTVKADIPKTTAKAVYRDTGRAGGGGGGSFDSPLILSVPKDKYASVIFYENGSRVATVRVGN